MMGPSFQIYGVWIWCHLLMFVLLPSTSQSFMTSIKLQAHIIRADTSLLGGGLFGFERDENPSESLQQSDNIDSVPVPPPARVIEIPVTSIKRGGLRFALGLHLIGLEQAKETWRPNQSSDNVLDMYFIKDNSAMFQITIDDDAIRVDRYGKPSLQYLLQESVVLHGVLDELNTLCFDGEIAVGNRLLQLEEPGDAIDKARAILPARRA